MVACPPEWRLELRASSLSERLTSVSGSDCRFSACYPSTVACACLSLALWKLKLADRAHASGPVLQFLAKLLSTDAVSNVWRTESELLSALACIWNRFCVSKQSSILLCYQHLGSLLQEKIPSFLEEG